MFGIASLLLTESYISSALSQHNQVTTTWDGSPQKISSCYNGEAKHNLNIQENQKPSDRQ